MSALTRETILRTLQEHKEEIRAFGVKKLVLFGSYAKDTQTPNSDIDLLVDFDKTSYSIDNHLALLYLLEDLFKKKIDLVKTHMVREELREEILGGTQYVAQI